MVAKIRWVVLLLSFLAIGVIVWWLGPKLSYDAYYPLESRTARVVTILFVVLGWAGLKLLRRWQTRRAGDQLMVAVAEQGSADEPSAEVLQLRERFEEAVATLKQGRRLGPSLYDLPWYIIIGPPGSGKTTALLNSGLKFPAEQRVGRAALRGVGGTRNCDWWFTDDAVFIDTAGRYLTQDSDLAADSAAWGEFLALLRQYRARRPINGVLLTISAQDLALQGRAELEHHIAAARRRLDELGRELRIELPVYVLVTKCDLVAGFAEYFDDLTKEGRAQVCGTTFPYEQTVDGTAARSYPPEFDALVGRLNERLPVRLDEERDPGWRAKMFGFPQQLAVLRDQLMTYVEEVFDSTRFDQKIMLRGVYFTSGTQEGTPIDRLLTAVGRRFAIAAEAASVPSGQGKAFFVEHLLSRVVLPESGLAGTNRRLELRNMILQGGTLALALLVGLLGFVALHVSAGRNREHVADVSAVVSNLDWYPREYVAGSPESLLPRLNAIREVVDIADRHQEERPWSLSWWTRRWGLHQGGTLSDAARDAYARELESGLLQQVADRIEDRLEQSAEPRDLYDNFKAYLMLGGECPRDPVQLSTIARDVFQAAVGGDTYAAVELSEHFDRLLLYRPDLRSRPPDAALVQQARNSLETVSLPELVFRELDLSFGSDATTDPGAVRLDQVGVSADRVLRRRSETPLSEPISAFYTAAVFKEVTGGGSASLARFSDRCVWGAGGLPRISRAMEQELFDIYEQAYIEVWDEVIADIEPVVSGPQSLREQQLEILGAPTSPLRALLQTIDEQTYLAPPPDPSATPSLSDRAFGQGRDLLGLDAASVPGTAVTQHFAAFHALVEGAGTAQVEDLLARLNTIRRLLGQLGEGAGRIPPQDPRAVSIIADIQREADSLANTARDFPETMRSAISSLAGSAGGVGNVVGPLVERYRREVVARCQTLVGRYPFADSRTDVTLAEFADVFGQNGVYDAFFRDSFEGRADTSRVPWQWRPGSGMGSASGRAMLRKFEEASRIQEVWFPRGQLEVAFEVGVSGVEPEVRQFTLDVGSASLRYLRGSPLEAVSVMWPGQTSGASFAFDARNVETGPWAWFRLVERTRRRPVSGSRYELDFFSGRQRATVFVESAPGRHPVRALELLRNFRCGA